MLTVRDLMTTAVITLQSSETIGTADEDMRLASIRHMPVLDDRGRLVGILSNRDLMRAMRRNNKERVVIADVMTSSPHTIGEDDPAYRAAELMLEHKIGSLPVVADDGHLVGMITETDFLRLADRMLRRRDDGVSSTIRR
jgi:CBS domain-containing protein